MDDAAKKTLLKYIPSGLYVIGLAMGKETHGFAGSWLSQVSFKPPVIMLAMREDSGRLPMVKKGRVLTVNFIGKNSKETIQKFFRRASVHGETLDEVPHFPGPATGAPVLQEAIGYLECKVVKITDGFGDHAAVFAEVVDAKVIRDEPPLLMSDTPWSYGG